jgi:membrane protein required for colicin V production
MAILDIVIIVLIFISVLVGLLRGFTKELMSIAAWVISIYLAFNFYHLITPYLAAYINQDNLSNIAGGAIIFVGSLFTLSMVGYLISKAVAATGIKGTDRVLGAVLGLVRGVLIISLFVVVTSIFNVKSTSWWNNSEFIAHFVPIADAINSVLPEEFKIKEAEGSTSAIGSDTVINAASNIISKSTSAPEVVQPTK